MKKADCIVIASILLLAGGIAACFFGSAFHRGETAKLLLCVSADGEKSFYPLGEEQILTLTSNVHTMTVVIEQGSVHVCSCDCPDGVCVRTKPISRSGECILCVPAKILLTIAEKDALPSAGSEEYDGIAG